MMTMFGSFSGAAWAVVQTAAVKNKNARILVMERDNTLICFIHMFGRCCSRQLIFGLLLALILTFSPRRRNCFRAFPFSRQSVRPIPPPVFPKTRRAFLLLPRGRRPG